MNTQSHKQESTNSDSLKEHYDLNYSKAKPNRFSDRLAKESLMVVLDPDMAQIFPTSEAVNAALRVLAAAAHNLPDAKSQRPYKKQNPALPATLQA